MRGNLKVSMGNRELLQIDHELLFERSSYLSDLFAEQLNIKMALQQALIYILESIDRPGGLIIVQGSAESLPWVVIRHNLPKLWEQQADNPMSELRQIGQRVLESGENATPDPELQLATAFPLTSKSTRQGVIHQGVFLIVGEEISPEKILELEYLNRVVGRAVQLKRLDESNQFQGQELAAMQMVINTLSTNSEVDDLHAGLTKGVSQILNTEKCFLVILDKEHLQAVIKKTLGDDSSWIYQASSSITKSLVAECLRNKRPILVNDVADHPLFNPEMDSLEGVQARSFMAAPLIVDDETQGALVVLNKRGGVFEVYDKKLLMTMATLIAYSINEISLVRQLKVSNADLQASRWELLRSRNILRALFDNIPLSLYIVDRKYNLLAINISRSERTGKEPNLLVGQLCYKVLHGRDDPCPDCLVSRTLFKGESTFRISRTWDTDREPLEWEIYSYPIYDENGQVLQAILQEQDVTEKRRLESKLIQSEKLAAVGQLAAGLAHEINNPLTAIIANAQILQRDPSLEEEVRESIELIALAGSRAGQVVRNLLDLSRKEQYEFRLTDLNKNIQKALDLLQYELTSRDIKLTLDLDSHLPPILTSPDHIEGVWINLIVNAIDALSSKDERSITITTRKNQREIQVSVQDNGEGIEPERIDRIFEPFYTTKAAGHGTGLGLAVCQQILKLHGGSIAVKSKFGEGTTFTVTLPVR